MAARVTSESARRVSGCVTALLREQPFFGSLALRLPIRADSSRETVASDGREIRYSPRWIADTEAHVIETAMARVVLACALKHHTRRSERDPERWQRASQLVTHGLLRDAGFTLPPDAEAWDGISVEQAYDRLPEPHPDDGDGDSDAPSGGGAAGADFAGTPPSPDSGGDNDSGGSDDGDGDDDPQDSDGQETGADAPPSCDPAGTGEVMDAPADSGQGGGGPSPSEVAAEEQAWDEAMHQAASLAKAQGRMPGAVEDTVRGAHVSTVDWRTLLRRYMTDASKSDYSWSLPNRRFIDSGLYLPSIRSEGIDTIAVIVDTSGSLPAGTLAEFWAEVREVASGTSAGARHPSAGRRRGAGRGRIRHRRPARRNRDQGPWRHRLPSGLRLARRARHPARRLPLPHRHAVFELPGNGTSIRRDLVQLVRPARRLEPRALGRAHRHRNLFGGCAVSRAIYGAPAEALRQALDALARLAFWISWTADPDLRPDIPVSTRNMRGAAAALRKAADVLDLAADRAEALDEASGPGNSSHPRPLPR